jgi:hypothetical protein
VRQLGFDDRFIRMWDFYLAGCEGSFLERHIGDAQLLLTRNHNPQTLFGEPWVADYHPETRSDENGCHIGMRTHKRNAAERL